MLFATTLDADVSKVRRKRLVVVMLVAHCSLLLETFIMSTWLKIIKSLNCCSFHDQFLQSQHLSCRTVWDSLQFRYDSACYIRNFLAVETSTTQLYFDWISISLIELSSYRLFDLELYCIRDASINEKTSYCNRCLLLKVFYLSTQFLMFWIENETIEVIALVLFLQIWFEYRRFISYDSFDKLRERFQLSWCSWSVVTAMNNRDLKWLTLVAKNVNEIEWLKLLV